MSKFIPNHPVFKLGRGPVRHDARNFQFAELRSARKVVLPVSYSIDQQFPGVKPRMFLNDTLGDCVMAARANYTERAKLSETSKLINITDAEVKKEYFKETGGVDSGLVILDSLNAWRKGWVAGGKTLKLKAFTQLTVANKVQINTAIFMSGGAYIGIDLPQTAQAEISAHKPWAITSGRGSTPGSWGGHCVWVVAYNATGPICVTWGLYQQMTWAWFYKYCLEAYSLVDLVNPSSIYDMRAVNEHLARAA